VTKMPLVGTGSFQDASCLSGNTIKTYTCEPSWRLTQSKVEDNGHGPLQPISSNNGYSHGNCATTLDPARIWKRGQSKAVLRLTTFTTTACKYLSKFICVM
jgi:hypothetical protein